MSTEFRADIYPTPTAMVVAVRGEVDLLTAPILAEQVHEAHDMHACLVLDLAETTFLDSAGVKIIAGAIDRSLRAGGHGSIVVRSPSDQIRRILTVAGLTPFIDIEPDEAGQLHAHR